ncbi:hypothetical protein BH09SUM1_BH09SUM1_15330 [soil metagenome]
MNVKAFIALLVFVLRSSIALADTSGTLLIRHSKPDVKVSEPALEYLNQTPVLMARFRKFSVTQESGMIKHNTSISWILWSDGTILWSEERPFGGTPYWIAKMNEAQFEELRKGVLDSTPAVISYNLVFADFHDNITWTIGEIGMEPGRYYGSHHYDFEETHPGWIYNPRGKDIKMLTNALPEDWLISHETEETKEYLNMRLDSLMWDALIGKVTASVLPDAKILDEYVVAIRPPVASK